jgi:hypothetical protein
MTIRAWSLSIACLLGPLPQGAPELRGGWVAHDSIGTPADRASMIQKFRRAHLNTAFVAVPSIGGQYGTTDPAAFGAFVDDAKAAGLQVHAWFQNFKRLGEATQADFTSAAEREAQKKWVLDLLAAYPKLDGVELDYIRTSTWEACSAAKLQGIDETIRLIREALPGRPLTAAVFNAASISYRGWKPAWEGDVPQWYRDWYAANPSNYYVQEAAKPGNNANWLLGPSFYSYQQDPPAWLKAGRLDAVASMQYTSVDATWQSEVSIWKSLLTHQGVGHGRIYVGLGWMAATQWFSDSAFDPAAMVRFVKHGRAQGIGGFVIFRLGQPGVDDGPLLDALSVDGPLNGHDAPFKTDVASPLAGGSGGPPPVAPPSGTGGGDDGREGDEGCGLTGLEALLALGLTSPGIRRRSGRRAA